MKRRASRYRYLAIATAKKNILLSYKKQIYKMNGGCYLTGEITICYRRQLMNLSIPVLCMLVLYQTHMLGLPVNYMKLT